MRKQLEKSKKSGSVREIVGTEGDLDRETKQRATGHISGLGREGAPRPNLSLQRRAAFSSLQPPAAQSCWKENGGGHCTAMASPVAMQRTLVARPFPWRELGHVLDDVVHTCCIVVLDAPEHPFAGVNRVRHVHAGSKGVHAPG